jgi:hypothetical protein
MNPLALGIGLSGNYTVNIDGMKAQLEAEKAAAEQAVAARKARDKETSDVVKSATDFLGNSKVAPMYKDALMSEYQKTIQEVSSIRKNGGDFGLDAQKAISKFKETAGHYVASSDEFYKSYNDLPPSVRETFNDPKGLERAAQVAAENAQTSYAFGDKNENYVMYPTKIGDPVKDYMTALNARKADTEPIPGSENSFTIPKTNTVVYTQQHGLNPEAQRQMVAEYTGQLLNAQNLPATLIRTYGKVDMDKHFEPGPGGQGMVPSKAVVDDITARVKKDVDARYRETKERSGSIPQPKTVPASASEKAFTKGAAWTRGDVRGFNYNSKTSNTEVPIDIDATTYEMAPDGSYAPTKKPASRYNANPAGPILIQNKKDPTKDNLYFSYNYTNPTNKKITTYLLPGTQKAFVDFVTDLRIKDDSEELQAFMEDLNGLVKSSGKKLIQSYVDELRNSGIDITLPQSAGGSSAKPASSSTAPKNPFATK